MTNFDIEMNDIKIFSDEYMRKINLKGYILENKYPNNKFKEKHMIFLINPKNANSFASQLHFFPIPLSM